MSPKQKPTILKASKPSEPFLKHHHSLMLYRVYLGLKSACDSVSWGFLLNRASEYLVLIVHINILSQILSCKTFILNPRNYLFWV